MSDSVDTNLADIAHAPDENKLSYEIRANGTKKILVEEPLIAMEEPVSLGDLKTTLPPENDFDNVRIILVIGKNFEECKDFGSFCYPL